MRTGDFGRWLSTHWWAALEALGFGKDRWEALDPFTRRASKTAFWLVVALILIAVGGVWKFSALVAAAIVAALVLAPWQRLPLGRWIVPAVVLALAVLYPFYRSHIFGSPIFGPAPAMDTMVVMMIFTMMALGLNIVVGYAGLLGERTPEGA